MKQIYCELLCRGGTLRAVFWPVHLLFFNAQVV
jgi:hypothetical protein